MQQGRVQISLLRYGNRKSSMTDYRLATQMVWFRQRYGNVPEEYIRVYTSMY